MYIGFCRQCGIEVLSSEVDSVDTHTVIVMAEDGTPSPTPCGPVEFDRTCPHGIPYNGPQCNDCAW